MVLSYTQEQLYLNFYLYPCKERKFSAKDYVGYRFIYFNFQLSKWGGSGMLNFGSYFTTASSKAKIK